MDYRTLRATLVTVFIITAFVLIVGHIWTHAWILPKDGVGGHPSFWFGLAIIALQIISTLIPLLRMPKNGNRNVNEKTAEFAYSVCIALGILGTFLGFSMIFHQFAAPGSGAVSPPKFTADTYADIKLAFSTSITGIVLASLFDFAATLLRNKCEALARERTAAEEWQDEDSLIDAEIDAHADDQIDKAHSKNPFEYCRRILTPISEKIAARKKFSDLFRRKAMHTLRRPGAASRLRDETDGNGKDPFGGNGKGPGAGKGTGPEKKTRTGKDSETGKGSGARKGARDRSQKDKKATGKSPRTKSKSGGKGKAEATGGRPKAKSKPGEGDSGSRTKSGPKGKST